MLASIGDYLKAWEPYELFPTILICLLAWLVGGGYLFQKILGKRTNQRKYKFQQGLLVSVLAGAGGGFAALALYFIIRTFFPVKPDPYSLPINWFGIILGSVGYLVVSFLVVFSMHKLPAGDVIRGSAVPIIAPILFIAIVTGSSFYFLSYQRVQVQRRHNKLVYDTMLLQNDIYNALQKRKLQTGKVAVSLEELVKEDYLEPGKIQSPAKPNGRGFFFNGDKTNTNGNSKKIILCDYKENFGDKGRVVLYEGGNVEFLTPESFQDRLEQIENIAFGKALREAEKK